MKFIYEIQKKDKLQVNRYTIIFDNWKWILIARNRGGDRV